MAQRLIRTARNSPPALLTLLTPLLLLGPATAQTAPIAPAPAAPPAMTLARALAAIPPPRKSVLLAVGADAVTLPVGAVAPAPGETDVVPIANAYGDTVQTFGAVVAVAPATRVVLNENPAPPEITSDLSSYSAFKVLAASLDDTQWALLTSQGGLGLGDLTDDTQRALFHALFRRGHLWVAPKDPAKERLPDAQRTDTRDVSDQIDGVRLRLGQTAHIYLNDRKGRTIYFSDYAKSVGRLHTWSPKQEPPAVQNGVTLRATIANAPHPGDLSPKDAALAAPISLAGLKTVEDLVTRIVSGTHKEIYADPHYAHRPLTVIGLLPSAPASDLLGALALSVAGTYRRVGPALVLTDDLPGVGTRRQRLHEWQDAVSELDVANITKASDRAGVALFKRRASARALSSFGDPLGLTPTQVAGLKDDTVVHGVPGTDDHYPPAKLTPGQQASVGRIAADYEQQLAEGTLPSYLMEDGVRVPDPTGPVTLRTDYTVQFLIPSVDGAVDTGLAGPLTLLFYPGEAAALTEMQLQTKPPAPPQMPPAPPLLPLLRSRPRRGILAHPKTPADVDAVVAAMKTLGLNDLYVDVFSGGVSHLSTAGADILAEALKQTAGAKIAVYAALSLLN